MTSPRSHSLGLREPALGPGRVCLQACAQPAPTLHRQAEPARRPLRLYGTFHSISYSMSRESSKRWVWVSPALTGTSTALSHTQILEDLKSPKSLIPSLTDCATEGKSHDLSEPPKERVRVAPSFRSMVPGEREQTPGPAKVFRSHPGVQKPRPAPKRDDRCSKGGAGSPRKIPQELWGLYKQLQMTGCQAPPATGRAQGQ